MQTILVHKYFAPLHPVGYFKYPEYQELDPQTTNSKYTRIITEYINKWKRHFTCT